MSTPPLSVVVPTKDPWPGLKDCLDALLDQVSETGAELIVVDGSGGGLPADEASPYRRVKLVRAPGESVFDLRVRGVDASRGDRRGCAGHRARRAVRARGRSCP